MTPRSDLTVLLEAPQAYRGMSTIPAAYVNPGLSLAQIGAIIRAYRVVIVLVVVAAMTAVALVVAVLPRTYSATATLMVSYDVNDPLNGKEFPVGLLGSYIATQIELMQNPEVLLPVVDRLKLTKNEDYTAGYSGNGSTLREWAAARLSKNLSIYQGAFASQLIHVKYSASSAAEAALVSNAVVDIYMEQDAVRSTRPATERARRYAEQLEKLKVKVIAAQDEVTAFNQRNALIDSGAANVDVTLLSSLEQQLVEAQNARWGAEVRKSGDQSVGDLVLASPLIQSLKTKLADQQVRLAAMDLLFLPNNALMLELQSQIKATGAALEAETSSYTSNASASLVGARQLVQKLQAAVELERRRVLTESKLHDDSAKYQLELASTQAVYKRALEGYDQIMFASSGRYSNVDVVSRARPPVKAAQPRVLIYLLLGFAGALVLGLLGPVAYELLNRRVRCRDDLERDHGIPVLVDFGPLPRVRHAS